MIQERDCWQRRRCLL